MWKSQSYFSVTSFIPKTSYWWVGYHPSQITNLSKVDTCTGTLVGKDDRCDMGPGAERCDAWIIIDIWGEPHVLLYTSWERLLKTLLKMRAKSHFRQELHSLQSKTHPKKGRFTTNLPKVITHKAGGGRWCSKADTWDSYKDHAPSGGKYMMQTVLTPQVKCT